MADNDSIKKIFLQKKIVPLFPKNFYRPLAYFATTLTGLTALCSQVIWQRHLAILTGSEARSLSLVIAVFLFGLATGYYVFGLLTEKNKRPRFLMMKYYGYVELLTGLYIGLFPFYFEFLKKLSFQSPNLLIIDLLISLMALLLPTFLMGASIPLLTATLPENSKEISITHAKVYGWNSFGACFGALISGFYLIPSYGLNLSLVCIGILNVLASLVFIGNSLEGPVHKQEEPPTVPSPLSNSFFMIFTFITGALIISFEIFCVRILNLSLGAGVYNFPMILSLFIGGLAMGSLSIKKKKLSIRFFIRQMLITLFLLQIVFYTAPYWSIWFSHIKVSLSPLPSNYFIYYSLVFSFLFLALFPTIFFMGRLLPLSYAFLKKNKGNYGKLCGQLYFSNTLGTVFGAIFIGYLAFYLFNLDILFKTNLYILFLLTLTILIYTKHKIQLTTLSVLGLILLLLPTQWNRTGHEIGYFRINQYNPRFHFKKLFFLPANRNKRSSVSFLKDGPNSTVSLINFSIEKNAPHFLYLKKLFDFKSATNNYSYSVVVNGKSDGNSLGDFSTMFFMIPYIYAPKKNNLETALIGLGTGVSAGSYIALEDVKSVNVLEISPFVIKAIQNTNPNLNFHAMRNKKVSITEIDAFKYFTRSKKKFDIIVSEPSNPWVLGVENLFTLEFYETVAQSLHEGGVFGQWLQTYEMDLKTIKMIMATLHRVFPHASLYQIGHGDMLILASLTKLQNPSEKRFKHPFIQKFYKAMGFKEIEDIQLTQILDSFYFNQIAKTSQLKINTLTEPQLIYRANKAMFLSIKINPFQLKSKFQIDKKTETTKMKAFNKYKNKTAEEWEKECVPHTGFNFFCALMQQYSKSWKFLTDYRRNSFERFPQYLFLRNQGLIPYDKKIMDEFFNESIKQKNKNLDAMAKYIDEKIKQKNYEGAEKDAFTFRKNNLINELHYNNFKQGLKEIRNTHHFLEKTKTNIK